MASRRMLLRYLPALCASALLRPGVARNAAAARRGFSGPAPSAGIANDGYTIEVLESGEDMLIAMLQAGGAPNALSAVIENRSRFEIEVKIGRSGQLIQSARIMSNGVWYADFHEAGTYQIWVSVEGGSSLPPVELRLPRPS
jgi:hypothetical protein